MRGDRLATVEPAMRNQAGEAEASHETRDEVWQAERLAGCDPRALAASFGTPLYVYDLDALARRAARLRAALPDQVDIAYAVKANPSLAVIASLRAVGMGADVSSQGELAAALQAGMAPASIVVTGPGKSDALLRRAVELGVRAIAVDSPGEVARIEALARADRRARLLFRVADPDDSGAGRGHGAGQVFGMSWEDALAAARRAVEAEHLDPLGVHAFTVSAVLDAHILVDHVGRTVAAGRRLADAAGFPLRLVDVGGGLGIPYGERDEPLDLAVFAAGVAGVVREAAGDPASEALRILIEPGRYLVGPVGAYLARVVDVKRLDGRYVAILDGGINHLLAPALPGRAHRMRLVTSASPAHRESVPLVLTGPLCTGLDVLGRAEAFPRPVPGDLVAFLDTGAYGFTQSMPWFLSHPGPAEVAASGGRAVLVRPRLDPSDLVERQRIPSW
jgi:diaminopimelate decarboxylase